MGKVASLCVSGVSFMGMVAAIAQEDPPPRVRQICDPTLPENADVCAPDTFEVIFGTDKMSTDSVLQYTTLPADPIDVTIVTDTKSYWVQGWSYGVMHDTSLLTILEATIGGTDAQWGLIGGFDATTIDVERCDDEKCANRTKGGGFVSAVVLGFKGSARPLVSNQRNSICKVKYKVDEDVGVAGTYLEFTDLLFISGRDLFETYFEANGRTKKWTNATDGWVKKASGEARFRRGDANDDGKVDIADPVWIINEFVRQGPATKCQDAADANDDGRMDLSDVMYLIGWQFRGQSAPPAPGPFACGDDPVADTLSCAEGSTDHCR
jgi:hypothetical protein